jgi:membrane protein
VKRLKTSLELLKETAKAWVDHRAPRLGAALAFYTLFAIAPLFLIVLAVAGLWFGEDAARDHLFHQLAGLVGKQGGEAIQSIIIAADKPKAGTVATIVAVLTLFVGATGVFVQLQGALNTIWNVRKKPGHGIRYFVRARMLSFAVVLAMGFLLLVSLVINAGLSAFGKYVSGVLPAQETIWQGINFVVSFGVITLLFAMIFRLLPDVRISWHDVWLGAMLTALLFNVGKFFLGLYLGKSSAASTYGAAGSLVIILMWVYYSSQILFFGAEFTRVYATKCGSHLRPAPGSQFVAVKEVKTSAPAGA